MVDTITGTQHIDLVQLATIVESLTNFQEIAEEELLHLNHRDNLTDATDLTELEDD